MRHDDLCCRCSGGFVGRGDGGSFSRSGRRLEEDVGVSEGESVRRHKPECSIIIAPLTAVTASDQTFTSSESESSSPDWKNVTFSLSV